MKKYIFCALFVLCGGFLPAQENTELMIINPGRETFAHFPSATLGNEYNLTVFLPESFVPLKGRYPLAVVLGLGAEESKAAETFLETDKVIVAGINFTEKDYAEPEKIARFVSRELLPYLETNYPILAGKENRIIAAQGKSGARVALMLASTPKTVGGVALLSPADAVVELSLPSRGSTRILVMGTQAELADSQRILEKNGWQYGPDFALLEKTENKFWDLLKKDYLFAPAQDLSLVALKAKLEKSFISLSSKESVGLSIVARLKNKRTFAYVPHTLRISPPYLLWKPSLGLLTAISGGERGTVKIHSEQVKPNFSVKLRLKK